MTVKKSILLALLLGGVTSVNAQTNAQKTSQYYEVARKNDKAKLTFFFSQMPKGGDLHHHYSGAIYAETYGGAPGFLRISARSAGTSFTITSSSGTDTSTVARLIVESS